MAQKQLSFNTLLLNPTLPHPATAIPASEPESSKKKKTL